MASATASQPETTPLLPNKSNKWKAANAKISAMSAFGDVSGNAFTAGDDFGTTPDPSPEDEEALSELLKKSGVKDSTAPKSDEPGVLFQLGLCIFVIFINVYEGVLKGKAVNSGVKFNYASIMLVASLSAVAIGGLMTVRYGDMMEHVCNAKSMMKIPLYIVPAALFTMGMYIQFICLEHLPVHIFWVLDQGRIMTVAALSKVFINRSQSWASWNVLVSITLAAGVYTLVDTLVHEKHELEEALSNANKGEMRVVTEEEKNLKIGIGMTVLGVFTMSFASLFCEMVLKEKHVAPFYVQKTFMELCAIPVALASIYFIGPMMEDAGLKKATKPAPLFAGWDNVWTIAVFLVIAIKQWLVMILVKRMNSLANLLCGVIALTLIYPAVHFHNAIQGSHCPKESFLCPENLSMLNSNVLACSVLVCGCVISYTTAKRDRDRILMFHELAKKFGSDTSLGSV